MSYFYTKKERGGLKKNKLFDNVYSPAAAAKRRFSEEEVGGGR